MFKDSTVEEADEESDEDEEVFEDALDQLQLQGTNLAPSSTFWCQNLIMYIYVNFILNCI